MHLLVHPATPRGPVSRFDVAADRPEDGALRVSFRLDADLSRLRLPATGTPARADGLWHHACFEVFIAASGSPGYLEFNFSPTGQWAAYSFTGYRAGMRAPDLLAEPAAVWSRAPGRLELDVELRLDGLVPDAAAADLRVALAAVLEEQSGTITHWALRHPAEKPDFHHPDGFVLALPGRGRAHERGALRS